MVFDGILVCLLSRQVLLEKSFFRLAWMGAVVHRVLSILSFPLVVARSDMLGTLEFALKSGWEQGLFYAPLPLGITLPYLPLLWLSYVPAFLLSLDFRWVGCFFFFTLGLSLDFIFKKSHRNQEEIHHPVLFLIALWFLNPYLNFRHELHLDLFHLLCVWATFFAVRGRILGTSLLTGLCLVTYQLSWFLAPFWWMAASVHLRKRRLLSLMGSVGGSLCVSSLFVVPLLVREGLAFCQAITAHLKELSYYRGEFCLGFAPLFLRANFVF